MLPCVQLSSEVFRKGCVPACRIALVTVGATAAVLYDRGCRRLLALVWDSIHCGLMLAPLAAGASLGTQSDMSLGISLCNQAVRKFLIVIRKVVIR